MKKYIMISFFAWAFTYGVSAQNLSTRSNKFSVNLSDEKNLKDTSIPVITWVEPVNEVVLHREGKLHLTVGIHSPIQIKMVEISIREKDQAASRGSLMVKPKENEQHDLTVDRDVTLPDGVNILEITVVNIDGMASRSDRTVHVGETALADAARLNRHDYALLFVTDRYDNWDSLVNPIFDGRTIAAELKNTYGFQVDLVKNPSQDLIFRKLREYSEMKYEPLDELFIFFAGHGYYDEAFKEGYVVVKESLKDDPGKTSYVSYNRLRNIVNVIPCEHTFLMMDVCFGGTFDEALAAARDVGMYKDIPQSEFIIRKLAVKTRRYLTSGGKTYVSDGIPGQHSPFAKRVIEALNTRGGDDGILTLNELWPYVEKLKPEPRQGGFGDNAPGSEFIFIAK